MGFSMKNLPSSFQTDERTSHQQSGKVKKESGPESSETHLWRFHRRQHWNCPCPVHWIKHLLEISDPLQYSADSTLSRDSKDSGPSGTLNREMIHGKHDCH